MSLFLTLIGTIVVVEAFFRLRIRYGQCRNKIVKAMKGAARTIRSDTIPDQAKEKLLLGHSVELLVSSFVLFGLMLLTMSPLGVVVVVDGFSRGELLQFLSSPIGLVFSVFSAALYVFVRARLVND